MKKKLLSLFLAMLMVISVVPVFAINTSAATKHDAAYYTTHGITKVDKAEAQLTVAEKVMNKAAALFLEANVDIPDGMVFGDGAGQIPLLFLDWFAWEVYDLDPAAQWMYTDASGSTVKNGYVLGKLDKNMKGDIQVRINRMANYSKIAAQGFEIIANPSTDDEIGWNRFVEYIVMFGTELNAGNFSDIPKIFGSLVWDIRYPCPWASDGWMNNLLAVLNPTTALHDAGFKLTGNADADRIVTLAYLSKAGNYVAPDVVVDVANLPAWFVALFAQKGATDEWFSVLDTASNATNKTYFDKYVNAGAYPKFTKVAKSDDVNAYIKAYTYALAAELPDEVAQFFVTNKIVAPLGFKYSMFDAATIAELQKAMADTSKLKEAKEFIAKAMTASLGYANNSSYYYDSNYTFATKTTYTVSGTKKVTADYATGKYEITEEYSPAIVLNDAQKSLNHYADLLVNYNLTPAKGTNVDTYELASKVAIYKADGSADAAAIQAVIDATKTIDDYADFYVTEGLMFMVDYTNHNDVISWIDNPARSWSGNYEFYLPICLGKYKGSYLFNTLNMNAGDVGNIWDATFENGGFTNYYPSSLTYMELLRIYSSSSNRNYGQNCIFDPVYDITPFTMDEVATKGYTLQVDMKLNVDYDAVSPQSGVPFLQGIVDTDGGAGWGSVNGEHSLVYNFTAVEDDTNSTHFLPTSVGTCVGGPVVKLADYTVGTAAQKLAKYAEVSNPENITMTTTYQYKSGVLYESAKVAKIQTFKSTVTAKAASGTTPAVVCDPMVATTVTPTTTVLYNGKYQSATGSDAKLGFQVKDDNGTLTYRASEARLKYTNATYYFLRQYNRTLSELEIAQNHFADLMFYYGIDPEKVAGAIDDPEFSYYHFNEFVVGKDTAYGATVEAALASKHTAVETETPATYATAGQKVKTCAVCNATYYTEAIPAIGYGAFLVAKLPDLKAAKTNDEKFALITEILPAISLITDEEKQDTAITDAITEFNAQVTAYNTSVKAANTEAKAATQVAFTAIAAASLAVSGIWLVLTKKVF